MENDLKAAGREFYAALERLRQAVGLDGLQVSIAVFPEDYPEAVEAPAANAVAKLLCNALVLPEDRLNDLEAGPQRVLNNWGWMDRNIRAHVAVYYNR